MLHMNTVVDTLQMPQFIFQGYLEKKKSRTLAYVHKPVVYAENNIYHTTRGITRGLLASVIMNICPI